MKTEITADFYLVPQKQKLVNAVLNNNPEVIEKNLMYVPLGNLFEAKITLYKGNKELTVYMYEYANSEVYRGIIKQHINYIFE